jgi:hypothetical protein
MAGTAKREGKTRRSKQQLLVKFAAGNRMQWLSIVVKTFQISDSRFQIPDSRSQISDLRFRSQIQISDFKFQIPDLRLN